MYGWTQNTAARTESLGASLAGTAGTTITASATPNTKGSWTDIGSTASFTYELVTIVIQPTSVADFTLDVGINVGGNRFIIAEDLRAFCGHAREISVPFYLPLHVPAGSQLSARCQASTGSLTVSVIVMGHSCGLHGAPGYSRCIALYSPTTSRGISVDPGGTAHTKVRTEIIASTAQRVVGLFCYVGQDGDTARGAQSWILDIEQGGAGSEQIIVPNLFLGAGNFIDTPTPAAAGPWPCDIAAGARLSVNAQCNLNTAGDRLFDFAAWGFVP